MATILNNFKTDDPGMFFKGTCYDEFFLPSSPLYAHVRI